MNDWIIRLIEGGGYWGIALLMALENIVPPIPSEVIMGVGGILMARGAMAFWPLLIAGTIGSTLGNYAWFLIGDRLGYERLEPMVRRWGRWLTLEWGDVERASRFLRQHGHWLVFALRFSPVFRTMISLPAGLSHMRHVKFLAFTFAGAAIWNTLLILAGHWLAGALHDAARWLSWGTLALGVVMAVGYAYRVATWRPRDVAEATRST